MQDEADAVADQLAVRVGVVATFVSHDPNSSPNRALYSVVKQRHERGRIRSRNKRRPNQTRARARQLTAAEKTYDGKGPHQPHQRHRHSRQRQRVNVRAEVIQARKQDEVPDLASASICTHAQIARAASCVSTSSAQAARKQLATHHVQRADQGRTLEAVLRDRIAELLDGERRLLAGRSLHQRHIGLIQNRHPTHAPAREKHKPRRLPPRTKYNGQQREATGAQEAPHKHTTTHTATRPRVRTNLEHACVCVCVRLGVSEAVVVSCTRREGREKRTRPKRKNHKIPPRPVRLAQGARLLSTSFPAHSR